MKVHLLDRHAAAALRARHNERAYARAPSKLPVVLSADEVVRLTEPSRFPNHLRNDSRWQTGGGRLPWGGPSRYGRTIGAVTFGGLRSG